jgi:hypothetical protein
VSEIDDDLEGAQASIDQCFEVERYDSPIGRWTAVGVSVKGLDFAVVHRSIPFEDGIGDGVHLGPGQRLKSPLQETLGGIRILPIQLIAIIVEN